MPQVTDLFIVAGEPSGDLQGAKLIEELLKQQPSLKIGAVAGPRMRAFPIETHFQMENLQVMGFIDVVLALPKIARQFFAIRNRILSLNPKRVVCIDYPGFNLRLEQSLREKGYAGKLIHYICPTVWAWGKKRIGIMAKNLDLLLTILPFEPACFSKTNLAVRYVGHPLAQDVPPTAPRHLLGLFPGSRRTEVERNFPLQLKTARRLAALDPSLELAVSIASPSLEPLIRNLAPDLRSMDNYQLMASCRLALATSGTAALELALRRVPAVVNFAIKPLDLFLAQKIFRIDLPYYSLPNIIASEAVYPELFGPNLTEAALFRWAHQLWFDETARAACQTRCQTVRSRLGSGQASQTAASAILSLK